MGMYYILDGMKVVTVDNVIEWGTWFETANRTVKKTDINGIKVSTVFMGLDHSFGEGDPLLFETMAFDKDYRSISSPKEVPDICMRCSTWEQALAQHEKACGIVRGDNVVIFKKESMK